MELFLLAFDLAGGNEIYETLADWIKFNSRPLDERERRVARSVFGDAIRYDHVRLDERAWIGPPQLGICYVSFNHINSWRRMSDGVLIHELVHVWQYQRLGSVYIARSLRAQRSAEGYDYGGVERLESVRRAGRGLLDFNFEQQAEIIADYFRLRHGGAPRWSDPSCKHLPLYEYFVRQLRS